jgi:uncharacterized cupredoxin-like copper-binding protein
MAPAEATWLSQPRAGARGSGSSGVPRAETGALRRRPAGAGRLFPALVGLLALQLLLSGCGGSERSATVHVQIRYSRFIPAVVTVPHGQPITFVIQNDDPIDHEWIVGSEPVHRAHRTGTEPVHESRASEVTVPALSSRSTTITFAEHGSLAFICHLPGHEAYGMVGTLNVTRD